MSAEQEAGTITLPWFAERALMDAIAKMADQRIRDSASSTPKGTP